MQESLLYPLFFGTKVVSTSEMARVEKMAMQEGCSEEKFIEAAGSAAAMEAMKMVEEYRLPKKAVLLIGKGNKGADAYASGVALIEEGFHVTAYVSFPDDACSEWNRKFRERFVRKKGRVSNEEIHFDSSLIIDGLFGTGFKGTVDGRVETAILMANGSSLPILAIDLPSGLDGTTGEARGACIQASATVAMGLAKIGLFLRNGWQVAGRLVMGDFGLPDRFAKMAREIAFLPNPAKLPLPKIERCRHKYQAGYVVGFSGSETMRGAPKMAGLAALRAGAGIVRVFHKDDIGDAPMELISQKWNEKDWKRECARAGAVFAGPGLGTKGKMDWVRKISLPAVLDADLLQEKTVFPHNAILTPHRGEMLRLLGLRAVPQEEEFLSRCQKFVERKKVVLVLKGAPTFIFADHLPPLLIPRGDPGMATAGAGDVLTGILAGLLSQKMGLYEAAATGVYLHATAGEKAALEKTSYGLIAGDLIDFLPAAFHEIFHGLT